MFKNIIRELRNPSDIHSAQLPLFILSFLCGTTPFKLVGSYGKRRFVTSIIGYLITFGLITLFIVCFVIALDKDGSIVGYFYNDSDIPKIGDTLQLFSGLIGLTITYLYSILRRHKLVALIYQLAKSDDRLKILGIETDYKYTLHYILKILFVKITIYIIYMIGCYYLLKSVNANPNFTVWVSFFLPHLMICMSFVKFICFVKQIRHRFLLTNKVLIRLYARESGKNFVLGPSRLHKPLGISSVYSVTSQKSEDIVDAVARLHDLLCDICNLAEQYFTVQILTIVTISFVIIVFNSYYILEAFFDLEAGNSDFGSTLFVVFFAYQISMYGLGISGIVLVSTQSMRASEKTSYYVHKIINTTPNAELKQKLLHLSLQLIHRKVKFTACGLFVIDKRLLFTIVAAATTYLVILMQFTLTEQNRVSCSNTPKSYLNYTRQ